MAAGIAAADTGLLRDAGKARTLPRLAIRQRRQPVILHRVAVTKRCAARSAGRNLKRLPPFQIAVARPRQRAVRNLPQVAADRCVTIGGEYLPGGGYALTVRDSGIGMTEAEIHKALTPFGQVENKMTATHNGTGLGLPLAKAMLELHDGTLEITSAPGRGTCLTLNFPRERVGTGRRVAA